MSSQMTERPPSPSISDCSLSTVVRSLCSGTAVTASVEDVLKDAEKAEMCARTQEASRQLLT